MTVGPLRRGDPEHLGDYRLLGRLGEGGQGVVYLGVDRSGGKVAVKALRLRLTGSALSSFARELAAARQVAEFCTVPILDTGLDHEPPYIVSEYVDGPSLQRVVAERGPRSGRRCTGWPSAPSPRWRRSTAPAWCTAISSPPTCC